MKREYAFLSYMIPDHLRETVYNNSSNNMQDAANALEWHIYNGLCKNLQQEVRIFNILPIGSFPSYYKKGFIKESVFSTEYSSDNKNIGFCNFPIIKKQSQSRKIYTELKEWVKSSSSPKTLFVYTASAVFLGAVTKIKKEFPDLQVCDIIADLPSMSNLSSKKSFFKRLISKYYSNKAYENLGCVDGFVLLTKHMADYLKIDKPFCVMEGIATACEEFGVDENKKDGTKIILYAGTLHRRFGIMNLIEAFQNIPKKNYILQICGTGDSNELISAAAKSDSRIRFMGQLPREQVLKLQKKATVVVNPRQNIEEFTKYSFPSKNMEYLSSGIPLVAYKLDGIPDEYDNYIFYVKDNSISALTKKLTEVCEAEDNIIDLYCKRARNFVSENKNEVVQVKKILNMLNII